MIFAPSAGASTGPPAAFQAPKPAGDVGDRFQAHALRGLRRQRRALPGRAEEYEALVCGEDRLVIFALRIDPEFEHAARTVEGAGHAAFAIELANVAQVDEHDVVATVQRERVLRGQGLDLPFGGFDQRADVRGDVLRHGLFPWLQTMVGRVCARGQACPSSRHQVTRRAWFEWQRLSSAAGGNRSGKQGRAHAHEPIRQKTHPFAHRGVGASQAVADGRKRTQRIFVSARAPIDRIRLRRRNPALRKMPIDRGM